MDHETALREPEAGPVQDALIGTDVGGTHTDVSVVIGSRVVRGKALTTYDDFSRGVLDAVAVAADNCGLTTADLLARTKAFVNGTTVVTNALIDLKGGRTGVIVTSGFRDTFRFAGGPRRPILDDQMQVNAPDVVPRQAIVEVEERIDYAGREVTPLDVDGLLDRVAYLVDKFAVEAVAVCFLSSFASPRHELEAEAAIRERYPELFITLSHKVSPVLGENRRWTTAMLNSFVQKSAEQYLVSIDERLRGAGLAGGLVFFQGLGGVMSLDRAREFPLGLLGSGPAGGAIGAAATAERMGHPRMLVGDMGGTSFEAGLLLDGEVTVSKNVEIGLLSTGVSRVDLVSIGAGGGSVASVSERGVPRVGPESARSEPGPACYGRGGTEPTVTDAMVAMGFIDADRYLGGAFTLQPELGAKALDEKLGSHFGWTTEESAKAVHDLVVINMATALREVSVAKGYDPRDFVFLAYGGTLPLFAVQIARQLSMRKVIVPTNSSVFSALGVLFADFVARYDQTVNWDLAKTEEVGAVNESAARMVAQAIKDMAADGFAADEVEVSRAADFRYRGQAFDLTMDLPSRDLVAEDAPSMAADFLSLYERTYGEGTAWKGVPEQMLNYTVLARGRQERPVIAAEPVEPRDPESFKISTRRVFLPSVAEYRDVPVYDDVRFDPGASVVGPAIVDVSDTTLYIPPDTTATRDEYRNYILDLKAEDNDE
jgi:N-methylhydantoinase A